MLYQGRWRWMRFWKYGTSWLWTFNCRRGCLHKRLLFKKSQIQQLVKFSGYLRKWQFFYKESILHPCINFTESKKGKVQLIFWKRRRENLSFHNLMLNRCEWKHVAQQIFVAHRSLLSVSQSHWKQIYCRKLYFLRSIRHLFVQIQH